MKNHSPVEKKKNKDAVEEEDGKMNNSRRPCNKSSYSVYVYRF